uniref:Zinc finger and BTB domain containing 21 n=1 Tax=Neogobius melanostomus TaxID=47308 RepID=A0A8C6TSS7_9GOBI
QEFKLSLAHYSNPSHALSVLGVLNEQRLRGQMCDVLLIVADQKYSAHKSVLAASSEYFQSLFTRIDTESPKVVNLDFCEPDAFEIVLNYIYCSSLFVDKSSLAAIQELGYSLGIPFLTNIASRFSFSEGDENDAQARSVIVRRVKMDTAHPCYSSYPRESSETAPAQQSAPPPSVQNSYKSVRTCESIKSSAHTETPERKSIHPYASILKGNTSHIASVRNKQCLQSSALNKKRSRTNFICPYCGKVFVFQSQYRQHLKSHHPERTEQDTREDMCQGEELPQENNVDTGVYSCRLCNVKLSSLFEQGDHERGCRHATVCPYCGLRFSSPAVKKDHEVHCKYKKLTCLECMRTFKSSFSIWRHQVEVHNHNMMTSSLVLASEAVQF